jgi:hypothetical protein
MVQRLYPVKGHEGVFPSVGSVGGYTGVVLDMGTVGLKFGQLGQGVGDRLRCTIGQLMLKLPNVGGLWLRRPELEK